MVEDILKHCKSDTRLCLAADLTLPTQFVQTKTVAEWRKNAPNLDKRPMVFVMG